MRNISTKLGLLLLAAHLCGAQTQVDLSHQVKNTLPQTEGGTGVNITTASGCTTAGNAWNPATNTCTPGAGGLSGQTTTCLPKSATSSTSTSSSSLCDNGTQVSGTEPIVLGGATNGEYDITYTGVTAPSPPSNSVQLTVDGAVATPYKISFPTSGPTGTLKYLNCAAVPCVWDAGGGGGGSGFPIILGATSIAASSTTTAVTGLSVNGVTLNGAGSSSLFLNQAGGYTSPSGSGTVTASPKFQIPFYSATGTASTVTGDPDFTTDGVGHITAASYSTGGSTQGLTAFGVGTGTITATLPTNYVGIIGPASGTPAYFISLPATVPTAGQVLSAAAPTSVNGVSQAVTSWVTPGGGGSGALINITGSVTVSGCTVSGSQCVVGTPGATVTFSAIPGTYTSLKIISTNSTTDTTMATLNAQFNGDTAGHYLWQQAYSIGATPASAGSSGLTNALQVGATVGTGVGGVLANSSGTFELTIPNYAGTTFYKNIVSSASRWNGGPTVAQLQFGGFWESTAAITSISISSNGGGNFIAGTTFSVYGVQ